MRVLVFCQIFFLIYGPAGIRHTLLENTSVMVCPYCSKNIAADQLVPNRKLREAVDGFKKSLVVKAAAAAANPLAPIVVAPPPQQQTRYSQQSALPPQPRSQQTQPPAAPPPSRHTPPPSAAPAQVPSVVAAAAAASQTPAVDAAAAQPYANGEGADFVELPAADMQQLMGGEGADGYMVAGEGGMLTAPTAAPMWRPTGRPPVICYSCGGEGHFARDCPNPQPQQQAYYQGQQAYGDGYAPRERDHRVRGDSRDRSDGRESRSRDREHDDRERERKIRGQCRLYRFPLFLLYINCILCLMFGLSFRTLTYMSLCVYRARARP